MSSLCSSCRFNVLWVFYKITWFFELLFRPYMLSSTLAHGSTTPLLLINPLSFGSLFMFLLDMWCSLGFVRTFEVVVYALYAPTHSGFIVICDKPSICIWYMSCMSCIWPYGLYILCIWRYALHTPCILSGTLWPLINALYNLNMPLIFCHVCLVYNPMPCIGIVCSQPPYGSLIPGVYVSASLCLVFKGTIWPLITACVLVALCPLIHGV